MPAVDTFAENPPDYIVPGTVHPARLPGEPDRSGPSGPLGALGLVLRAVVTTLLAAVVAPLWVPFVIGALIWGYPPNTVRPAQALYYLGLAWHRTPPAWRLPPLGRFWLSVAIVRSVAFAPLAGLAWFLDELIYGRALAAVQIRAPIVKISAARSGSTQMARYIESDPRVISPTALQILLPYLWLWRLAAATVGRWVEKETVQRILKQRLPAEFVERHEVDAFGPETFEVGLISRHLNRFALFMGPRVLVEELCFGEAGPSTARLWNSIFVDLLDGTLRKTLLFAGAGPEQRIFVKGHFLAAADAVAERYPDGRFLTLVRQPSKRLRSMINFLWSNPVEAALGKPDWGWLVAGLAETERRYNQRELQWFTRDEGPRRLALRFGEYVADLEGTMSAVYAHCFDEETLPEWVPTTHAARERKHYSVDRSFEQLGLDPAAYDAAQPAFTAWALGRPVDQSSAATSSSDAPNSVSQASAAR